MDTEPVEMTSIAVGIAHKHSVSVFLHVDAGQFARQHRRRSTAIPERNSLPRNSVKNYVSYGIVWCWCRFTRHQYQYSYWLPRHGFHTISPCAASWLADQPSYFEPRTVSSLSRRSSAWLCRSAANSFCRSMCTRNAGRIRRSVL